AIAAWIFAIPGLLISWWAGLGYVPEGLRALREGRAARNGA
ncbi:MAG TPA: CDP-diacylglycerol--glycerol-3-phosphate 3-phosphatidyltransferase, partial [Acidimicrobiaceae bacterium]|nr:CDP-diacylglycerol--glycerol-3-phosphate 3-phosphatidyltransferase [Acidimicrobiaceae bacterium]